MLCMVKKKICIPAAVLTVVRRQKACKEPKTLFLLQVVEYGTSSSRVRLRSDLCMVMYGCTAPLLFPTWTSYSILE